MNLNAKIEVFKWAEKTLDGKLPVRYQTVEMVIKKHYEHYGRNVDPTEMMEINEYQYLEDAIGHLPEEAVSNYVDTEVNCIVNFDELDEMYRKAHDDELLEFCKTLDNNSLMHWVVVYLDPPNASVDYDHCDTESEAIKMVKKRRAQCGLLGKFEITYNLNRKKAWETYREHRYPN